MKTLSQKLLAGLLVIGLTTLVASAAQAGPPPQKKWIPGYPTPGGMNHHHHPPKPHPVIYPGPVYVVDNSDDSNPVPVADIQLLNPAENRVTLKYSLDGGQVRSLPAGTSVRINRAVVVSFDRGGGAGRARFSLTDGVYKFAPASGTWTLVRQTVENDAAAEVADADTNPAPAK
jgi:hypothetical protein